MMVVVGGEVFWVFQGVGKEVLIQWVVGDEGDVQVMVGGEYFGVFWIVGLQ